MGRFGWVVLAILPGAGLAQDAPLGCLIEPYETVRLSPATAAIVARVPVERGDLVKAGDLLVEFDQQAERLVLALAAAKAADRSRLQALEARQAFLDDQAKRLTELAGRGSSSSAAALEARMEAEVAARDADQERAALARAELERQAAEVALAKLRILAPIDGVVVQRQVAPGEYHDTQTPVMVLARLDRLHVEAFAPISLLARITTGQQVTVRPEAPVGGEWPAVVTVVDRVLDAATATFGFRMEMENPGLRLPAGLRCEVELSPPEGAE